MMKRLLTIAAMAVSAAIGAAPEGWHLAGSMPGSYDTGVDKTVIYNSLPSAYLRSKETSINGFGTLMQEFSAAQYVGKRVRFSAWVKTDGVADWAGLWMRVDGDSQSNKNLAFDNMQDRPFKGTSDWRKAEIVLDAPAGATGIYFGILLSGTGTAWLNNCKIEEVGNDVPTTAKSSQKLTRTGPVNLNFEK